MTLSNAILVAVTLAYGAIALASVWEGNFSKATVFSGYALANIGLIVAL